MEILNNKNGTISFKEKVYLQNGQTVTKTFKRKTDAVLWKRQFVTERDKNKALGIAPLKENLRFSEIFELWYSRKVKSVMSFKTAADYKSMGKTHILPFIGIELIRSIERSHGDRMIQHLKDKKLANRTVNKVLTVFKQVVSFAEMEGFIAKNPLRKFSLLKLNPGRVDFLTQQEILQLLRANVLEEIYPVLMVALNTGMRIGELTGLCWDRLNFETDTIEVSRTLGRGGLRNTTKTNMVRYIPMNYEVKVVFKQLMKNQKSPQFVFANANGTPLNPDHYSLRQFQVALDVASVRSVNFHVLRHTYASQYMMNGGNIYDLQKILGHSKVDMTMKYAHLSPQHLRKAVEFVRFSAEGDLSNSPFVALQENYENKRVGLSVVK